MGVGKVIDSESVAPDEENEYPPPDDNSALALATFATHLKMLKIPPQPQLTGGDSFGSPDMLATRKNITT